MLSSIRTIILAATMGLLSPAAISSDIWFVNEAAAGAATGQSWLDAFTDLQSALAVADSGDQIWVAEGTYRPDSGSHDTQASFVLRSGVELFGGFNGTESAATARDPDLHIAILSGDLAGNDDPESFIKGQKTSDNSAHVLYGFGTDSTCILDGFTVTGGVGGSVEGACDDWVGGGIALSQSNPVIRNCKVMLNRALFRGGGCFAGQGSAPVFDRCEFIQNVSDYNGGGGMALCGANPLIKDCRFENNRSKVVNGGPGGAILAVDSSPVILTSQFIRNRAYSAGAILAFEDSDMILDGCSFIGNTANITAGLGFSGSEFGVSSDGVVRNCVFIANEAGAYAGAIGIDTGSPRIENCTFVLNTCGTREGAGAISSFPLSLSPAASVRNCIFWDNAAGDQTGEQAQIWNGAEFFIIAVSYSIIQGLGPLLEGEGNIGVAPSFVDPGGVDLVVGTEDDDFRLAANSAGIDQADPLDKGRGADAWGMPRRLDGDLDGQALVDMGAFEFGHVTLAVDDVAIAGQPIVVSVGSTKPLQGVLFIGHGTGDMQIGSLGSILFDLGARWTRLVIGSLPTSLQWAVPKQIPAGATFTLQALGVDPLSSYGNFSNAQIVTVIDA